MARPSHATGRYTQMIIVWNESRTIGIAINLPEDETQLSHEIRKGTTNNLGVICPDFMEAWSEMTCLDQCTVESFTK